jgi:cell wall-associated NlpC family hydrolase
MSYKPLFGLFLTWFFLTSGSAFYAMPAGHPGKAKHAVATKHLPTPSTKADSLICFAEQFLGTPYHYACASPKAGFDCSGLVYYVFAHAGMAVPRSSRDYEHLGRDIPLDSCRKGDIIVFTGTNAAIRHAGHVGIVVSAVGEEVAFIQSSSSKKQHGVIISSFKDSPYYKNRFIKVVRVLK